MWERSTFKPLQKVQNPTTMSSVSENFVHILIVDDDQDDHFLLRRAINKVIPHAIVESVYDGAEALMYLEKGSAVPPDLIFLDLNMSKLSGKDTLKVISDNRQFNNVPVIIYSTSRNEKEKEEMLVMGAKDFYSKPYDLASLITIVENVKSKWLTAVPKRIGE
jgi:CheY-like chemotaxis protein